MDFDRGISSAVKRLRDALGDSADTPVFIETIERKGYRWIAPIQRKAEAPGPSSVTPPLPAASSWRHKSLYLLPLLALLLAAWGFRPAYRATKARAADGASAPAPSSDASSSSSAGHPANREAEELYLKGRYYWNRRTPESLKQAVDYFTQAIVHDPNYAQAYAGLADCYNLLREYTAMPASEAYPRAYAAAKKAAELDDSSSEAHASLAFVSFFGKWDVPAAEREFRRALELNPNNAVAHHWYATYLMCLGRFPEALAEIGRAQALDPNSASVLADRGDILIHAGRRDEGIALLKQLSAAEPNFISPHRYLGIAYLATGDYPAYLTEFTKEVQAENESSSRAVVRAAEEGLRRGNGRTMLEAMQREQKKLYDQGQLSSYNLAQTFALLGEKQEALQYLRVAYDKHADQVAEMVVDPYFQDLHSEPAFQELASRVGLPLK